MFRHVRRVSLGNRRRGGRQASRLLLERLEDRRLPASLGFTPFPIPTAGAAPLGIALGADGNLWFTETGDFGTEGKIGRLTTAGIFTEFPLPAHSVPENITAGPDGNLWFTKQTVTQAGIGTGSIGRITMAGAITEFALPAGTSPGGITAGPDGNVWFGAGPRLGRITPNGTITEFDLSLGPQVVVGALTTGPDGNLWVVTTDFFPSDSGPPFAATAALTVTPAGKVAHVYALAPAIRSSITTGPDGNLWFTGNTLGETLAPTDTIGRITPAGAVTLFNTPTPDGNAGAITPGPDGNLWFTESLLAHIGRITPAGSITEFASPYSNHAGSPGTEPAGIVSGPDGNLWYADFAGDQVIRINLRSGPNGRYVEQLYQVLLGRLADAQGLAGFKAALDNAQATDVQVAQAILNSGEFRADVVQRLYQTVLFRTADTAGLAGSVAFLAGGGTTLQLEALLLGSAEFFADAGNTNAGFIARLQQVVLGQAGAAAAAQAFERELDSGVSRTVVAQQALAGAAAEAVQIQRLYQSLLGRAADPVGLQAGVAVLQNGGSLEQLTLALVTSPEFIDHVNGNANQLFVAQLYHDLLQRAPDGMGLALYTGLLDSGTQNRLQIVSAIKSSTEFRTDEVQHLYQQVFGRSADPAGLASSVAFLAQGGKLSQLEAALLASDEFFTQEGNGTPSGFLSALYEVALHRAIDSSGAQSLSQALSSGASRASLVQAVLTSPEAHTQLVEMLYRRYLGRPADATGLASALGFLQASASSEELAAILIASPEYLSRL